MTKITINNKNEMAHLAKQIAALAEKGDVFALQGNLGAGKTFFAKNFINALQEKLSEVLSPTFNLVYSYQSKKGEVFHFDLYRLKNAEELENIGFFDALQNGISLIEWPEIAKDFLPKKHKKIIINFGKNEEEREVEID